nr:MAG TPA: C2H2 type zinc-finger protein [Caudoviricetes sp.]
MSIILLFSIMTFLVKLILTTHLPAQMDFLVISATFSTCEVCGKRSTGWTSWVI